MIRLPSRNLCICLFVLCFPAVAPAQVQDQIFVSNVGQVLDGYAPLARSYYVSTRFTPGRAISYRLRSVTLRLSRGAGCASSSDPLFLPVEVSVLTRGYAGSRHVVLERGVAAPLLSDAYTEHRFLLPSSSNLPLGAGGNGLVLVRSASGAPSDCVRVGLTSRTAEDLSSAPHWQIDNIYANRAHVEFRVSHNAERRGALIMLLSGDPVSDDVSLSSLSVTDSSGVVHALDPSAQDPDRFDPDVLYGVSVAPSVHTVTISAVPSVPTTSVDYYGLNNAPKRDADPVAPGFQLAVGPGRSVLLLRTESASRHYQYSTIIVHRPETLACAAPDLSDRRQLWASTLGLGMRVTGRGVSTHGFEFGTLGNSSVVPFELDGDSHEVRGMRGFAGSSFAGSLIVSFDAVLPPDRVADLSLHVCGRTFPFSDAFPLEGGLHYFWRSAGLDWTRALERHVTLSRSAASVDVDPFIPERPLRISVTPGWTSFACSNAACARRDRTQRALVVALEAGVRYRLEVHGGADERVRLHGGDGAFLASAFGPDVHPAILEHTPASAGDVFIRTNGGTRVRVVRADSSLGLDEVVGRFRSDCPDTRGPSACVAKVSDPKTAAIASSGDVDYWSLRLPAHQRYAVSVAPYSLGADATGALAAPELSLFTAGADGVWHERASAAADSEGVARLAYVRSSDPLTGRVALRVRGAGGATGAYVLWVRELSGALVSVSDASVTEASGAVMRFVLEIAPPADRELAVGYRTVDETALAGADYAASSGTLTIAEGASSATIEVLVLDDRHDEGSETFSLELLDVVGAELGRSRALGTIVNTDSAPRKWLARVGQSTARQLADAISDRVDADRGASRVVLAGRSLDPFARALAPSQLPVSGPARILDFEDALAGASFRLSGSPETSSPSPWALWGNVAHTGASSGGAEDLDVSVRSVLLGADVLLDDRVFGVVVANTEAAGGYAAGGPDALDASFVGLYPYAGLRTSAGGSLWAAAGGGSGDFMLDSDEGVRARSDLSYRMLSAGLRHPLIFSDASSTRVSFISDWSWSSMKSPGVPGAFARTSAYSNWLRAGVRAQRRFELDSGMHLDPRLDLGVRHDFGDAETGTGLDAQGSLGYASGRLSGRVGARALFSDADGDYREWSLDASLAFDATAANSARGLYLSVAPRVSQLSLAGDRRDPFALASLGEQSSAAVDVEARYGLAPGLLGRSVSVYSVVRFGPRVPSPTLGAAWSFAPLGQFTLETMEADATLALRAGLRARF